MNDKKNITAPSMGGGAERTASAKAVCAVSPVLGATFNHKTATMRNTVIFYRDWYDTLKELKPEERFKAYEAIFGYAFEGVVPADNLIKIATSLIRTVIDRDNEKYEQVCAKRKEAIAKRWREYKSIQVNTNVTDNNNNNNVNENDNVNDKPTTEVAGLEKEKDNNKLLSKKKNFVKPTVEQVEAYCRERGNYVDAQQFVDFYESKGWRVGSSPMKDWKAAVRTWEKRDGRKPADSGVNIGVGEWIDERGQRRYGTGKHTVPMSAPPRPSESSYWSGESNSWVMGV